MKNKKIVIARQCNDNKVSKLCTAKVQLDDSTTMTKMQPIEALLPRGRDHALTAQELLQLTNFRSTRDLRREIEKERQNGALILSSSGQSGGFFKPSTGEAGTMEIKRYIKYQRSIALSILKTLKPIKKELVTRENHRQLRLADDE